MATIAIKLTTFLFRTDDYRAQANAGRIQVQTRIPTTCWWNWSYSWDWSNWRNPRVVHATTSCKVSRTISIGWSSVTSFSFWLNLVTVRTNRKDTEHLWERLKVSILESARETLSVKRTQSSMDHSRDTRSDREALLLSGLW